MNEHPEAPAIEPRDLGSLVQLTHVVYGLLALGFALAGITGLLAIIAVVINYVKLDAVKGTWLESHFRWQIRTFWFSLLWLLVGWIFIFTVILFFLAFVVWGVAAIWFVYRIVKGWLSLADGIPMPL